MANLFGLIDHLINLNIEHGLIEPMDASYMRNRMLATFDEKEYDVTEEACGDLYVTLDALAAIAIEKGLIEDTGADRDIFTLGTSTCVVSPAAISGIVPPSRNHRRPINIAIIKVVSPITAVTIIDFTNNLFPFTRNLLRISIKVLLTFYLLLYLSSNRGFGYNSFLISYAALICVSL